MTCFSPYYNKITRAVCRCGHCAGCYNTRGQDWIFRVTQELKSHENSVFVTLTYNDDNLPDNGELVQIHVSNFLKRLRDRLGYNSGFCYFGCGEYGDRYGRPHYHIILYSVDISKEDIISECWRKGFVSVKSACAAHGGYICSYLLKCAVDTVRVPVVTSAGRNSVRYVKRMLDGRIAPFLFYSKGIGKNWLKTKDAETAEREGYVVMNGYKQPIPVYYQRKMDEKKTIYEREVARIDRQKWHIDQLKHRGLIKLWFSFEEWKELKIRKFQSLWKARIASEEKKIRDLRSLVGKYSMPLRKRLLNFGFEFCNLDDFILNYSKFDKFFKKDLYTRDGYEVFLDKLNNLNTVKNEYDIYLSEVRDEVDGISCTSRFKLFNDEYERAMRREFRLDKESRVQREKNYKAKQRAKGKKGVL